MPATPSLNPQLMPKRSWPYTIDKMAEIAANRFGKPFISEEHIHDIKAFYYGSSPEELPRLPYSNVSSDTLSFKPKTVNSSELPLISRITPVTLYGGKPEFLVCDVEANTVSYLSVKDGKWSEKVLAEIEVPSRTTTVDFDGDGDQDIVVSSLGLMFPPQGTFAGKVYLLQQTSPGQFKKVVLLDRIGRVNDAHALDLDGDKDLDIAIAVFGGDVNGALGWLEFDKNKYIKRGLSNLGGALNVSPVDLNKDGKVDLISYFSQEHEVVMAYINKGKGKFEEHPLFRSNHPMVGATSLEVVDLDNDGDADILFSNGDAHDLQYDPKPYHGVQWLENTGNLRFEYRDVGRFYGAAIARAGDLDGDGDQDIVTSSWNNYWDDPKRKSLIWFENDGKQNFSRRDVLAKPQSIAALALSDVNNDGRLDILAGVFEMDALKQKVQAMVDGKTAPKRKTGPRIVILENHQKIQKSPKKSH